MDLTERGAARERSTGIDLFRGALVVAVILGHFSELTARQSFLTWVGAGIRMPLFIGLTGYLFNLERARAGTVVGLLRAYYPRLLLPWLIACIVHLTVTERLGLLTPLSIIVHPPFHLWFVPVMMTFIVLATLAKRPPLAMLGIAIPCSIAAMYLLGVGHGAAPTHAWLPDRRFFIYPIYFFYGLWIARRPRDSWKESAAMVLAPIGLLWWCVLFQAPNLRAEVAAELITCLPLICLLPRVRTLTLSIPPLVAIGRDSLFFYLWHPMAFGLWAACGLTGMSMLILSMLTLAVVRAVCLRQDRVARLMGLQPQRRSATALVASPAGVPRDYP